MTSETWNQAAERIRQIIRAATDRGNEAAISKKEVKRRRRLLSAAGTPFKKQPTRHEAGPGMEAMLEGSGIDYHALSVVIDEQALEHGLSGFKVIAAQSGEEAQKSGIVAIDVVGLTTLLRAPMLHAFVYGALWARDNLSGSVEEIDVCGECGAPVEYDSRYDGDAPVNGCRAGRDCGELSSGGGSLIPMPPAKRVKVVRLDV